MKKILLLCATVLVLGAMTACKNGGMPAELDEATTTENTTDLSDNAELSWTSIDSILEKGQFLNEAECLFVLSDTTLDDGQSEGVGYYLFNLMRGNRQLNESFANARKDLTREDGDEALIRLMDLMSIDIALAEYGRYDDFLADFPVFRGCTGADAHFNWIKENFKD